MANEAKQNSGGGVGLVPYLVLIVLLTGMAGGSAFFASKMSSIVVGPVLKEAVLTEASAAKDKGKVVIPLPPIVTNLAEGTSPWVRLELSVLFSSDKTPEPGLAEKLSEDVVALLRTLSVAQIAGPTGWLHLREELKSRVGERSSGRVTEVMIHSMIVE